MSGWSSMIRMVFMRSVKRVRERRKTLYQQERGKPDGSRGANAGSAVKFEPPAMQRDTTIHDDEAQSGSREHSHIAAAGETREEPLAILFGDTDPAILDDETSLPAHPRDLEADRLVRERVLAGVREQITEDVPQERFVGLRPVEIAGEA